MLSAAERERYNRQILVDGLGEAAQEKLASARVLVAGAGGLGSALALYLTAAGVGTLRFIDHGTVELSNLNRQVLYTVDDLGKLKVDCLATRLERLNPEVRIETLSRSIDEGSVHGLMAECDMVVDALDSLPTRLLLNKAALERGLPLFHGAVNGFQGQAMTVLPGRSACLQCLYGEAKTSGVVPVLGTTPAVIACIQATELIKFVAGTGRLLVDRLLLYDGLSMSFREVAIHRDPQCTHCGNES